MHTIIRSLKLRKPSPAFARTAPFRQPHYSCEEHMNALKLVVYVPASDAAGVDIEVKRARSDKSPHREKPPGAHQLARAASRTGATRFIAFRLRLGFSLDYDALNAELVESGAHHHDS